MSKKADMQKYMRVEIAENIKGLSEHYAKELRKGTEEGEREAYLALCKIKQDMEDDGKHKRKWFRIK